MDSINKQREAINKVYVGGNAIPDIHKNVLTCLEHVRNIRSLNKRLDIALHGIKPENKATVGDNQPEENFSGTIQKLELSLDELRSELLLALEEYRSLILQLLGE